MHRRKSRRYGKRKLQRLSLPLFLLLSVLTALTGCGTTEIPDESPYEEILIGMIPDLPEPPSFPELQWELETNGRYSIPEEDADRLLDYRDNSLPLYRFEIERYQRELDILKNAIIQGNLTVPESLSR